MKKLCKDFKRNPDIDPSDGSKIEIGDKTFKKFLSKCKSEKLSKDDCFFFDKTSINPLTNRKISSQKTINKIGNQCNKISGKRFPKKSGCEAILVSGKRKGQRCGAETDTKFCKRHQVKKSSKVSRKKKSIVKETPEERVSPVKKKRISSPVRETPPSKRVSSQTEMIDKIKDDIEHLGDIIDMINNMNDYNLWNKEHYRVSKEVNEIKNEEAKRDMFTILDNLLTQVSENEVVKDILKSEKKKIKNMSKAEKVINKLNKIKDEILEADYNELDNFKDEFNKLLEELREIFDNNIPQEYDEKISEIVQTVNNDIEEREKILENRVDDIRGEYLKYYDEFMLADEDKLREIKTDLEDLLVRLDNYPQKFTLTTRDDINNLIDAVTERQEDFGKQKIVEKEMEINEKLDFLIKLSRETKDKEELKNILGDIKNLKTQTENEKLVSLIDLAIEEVKELISSKPTKTKGGRKRNPLVDF